MFKIEVASQNQIPAEKFDLFDEANDGDEFIIAINGAGGVVGYAQFTGATIHFIESIEKGAGSALMDWLKGKFDYLEALDCVRDAWGWYEKMGFEHSGAGRSADYQNMDWYAE